VSALHVHIRLAIMNWKLQTSNLGDVKMRNKNTKKYMLIGVIITGVIFASLAYSHCQIPCGIYDDPARFDEIAEHITTIEKSMNQIMELSAEPSKNANQLVRWVMNKEEHADEISHIVTFYFMAQRIKLPVEGDTGAYKEYVRKLTLLHEMLIYSMKAKQTTNLENIKKLRSLLEQFRTIYFDKVISADQTPG
jgi:nickel superoxide dismutase